MDYQIRKLNWKDLNERGIPKDCGDVMNYFNKALDNNLFPLVPRINKITEEEIKKIWIPRKDKNITIVAYSTKHHKVVGSGTLFVYDKSDTNYGITIDPEFIANGIGTEITKKIIEESLSEDITVKLYTSIENESMIRVMKKLGYKPNRTIENFEKYIDKVKANSFDVYEYIIN